MPWNSNYGSKMQEACKDIPGSAREDRGYSTPDVYGRAVQLYLALEQAAQDQEFHNEAVVMWRALLAMLALRNMLDLPLVWDYVQISSGDDLLGKSLIYPPKDADQLLYPNMAQYQWDGQTFYTLSWAPTGQDPVELAIYSPMTLIYPVADWRKVFSKIPQLDKFFNSATCSFREHQQSIQGGELNFVYPWLRDMREHLTQNMGNSNAKRNIILHLDQYMKELGDRDKSLAVTKLPLSPRQFGYVASLANLVPPLITAYDIGGPVFSDQLCVLRVDAKERNPFEPCEYSENYKIQGGPLEPGVDLYAFLPIHPGRREQCCENGLAESISMRLRTEQEGAELKRYIHVSASKADLPGIRLEKDYLLTEDESAEKNVAVYYKDFWNRNVVLNKDTWPLFSVWPTTLDANWKQYYVMRSSERNCLRISGEYGTPSAQTGGDAVEKGDNKWVVKTPYVPNALPLIRILRDDDGKLTDQSVAAGMVTPRRGLSVKGTGSAIVAVDFGTSSTRVFYTLAGNNQPVHEILVVQDKPLEVTRYEESMDRKAEMSTYFIAPGGVAEDNTLFSIFRRSEDKNQASVRPLLDGAIYQPNGQVTPDATQYLVTDLKWNGTLARPYYIAFMQQLCLHVMTYLYQKYQIASIEWHYALPRVMDETNRLGMSSIWENEVLDFLNTVSANTITHTVTIPPTQSEPKPSLPLLTESIAASRYFDKYLSRQVNPAKGYLVVDIGGGSTDVALWQRSGPKPTALKWHTSVRVAGRKMFTRWIEGSIDRMAAGIHDPDSEALLRVINEADFRKHPDTGAKEALVDRLLTTNSNALLANYKTNITTQPNDWGGVLRDKITQAVTLMMFSLGYQIGALMKVNRYIVPPGPGNFTIALGGRGSNVLHWLTCGNAMLTEFFKDGVKAVCESWPEEDNPDGSNPDENNPGKNIKCWPNQIAIKIITSDDPKCEVARGLLVPMPVGSPTGWEDVGNGEEMPDPYYYADEYSETQFDVDGNPKVSKEGAATVFCEAFKRRFPSGYDMKDLSDPSNQNELATSADRIRMDAHVDDVFKVLMESIYAVLEA